MIELAHGARIRVCCEGVETEEELLALQQLNPDVLQGFLFAQPYKKEEFERVSIFEECGNIRKGSAKKRLSGRWIQTEIKLFWKSSEEMKLSISWKVWMK